MQGTPARLSLAEIEQAMRDVPGVVAVHDLHVWTLGAGRDVMTGHAVLAPRTDPRQSHEILLQLRQTMHDRFAIEHTTIQLEFEDLKGDSELCSPAVDHADSSPR
jgi:cobalt-zinc-cadmium efflux system protein